MKSKTKQILGALIALAVVVGAMFAWRTLSQDHGEKNIHIQIIVDAKNIYDDTVDTDAGTLADLLKEMQADGKIQIAYSQSTYGMYIQGIGVDQLFNEEPANGKYWVYSSENNAQCLENNFCDAADLLMIEDGDEFVFELTAFES